MVSDKLECINFFESNFHEKMIVWKKLSDYKIRKLFTESFHIMIRRSVDSGYINTVFNLSTETLIISFNPVYVRCGDQPRSRCTSIGKDLTHSFNPAPVIGVTDTFRTLRLLLDILRISFSPVLKYRGVILMFVIY